MNERRVMIIGLDALTPELTWPWVAEGVLPNLARVLETGAGGPLRSTIPPCSPAAWSTFATGLNPGKHGIIGFSRTRSDDYRPRLATAADRAGETFWETAGRHGISGGILNLPFTYPPKPFNGFMISGMMTPRLGRAMASPPEVFDDLMAASPDYTIDVGLLSAVGEAPETILARLLDSLRARCRAAVGLYRKHRPPLFCVVFVAADRACHCFWPYLEAARSGQTLTPRQQRIAGAVRTTYAALDEAVGTLMAEAGADTDVLLLSDHGSGPLRAGLSLRKALAAAGLLTPTPPRPFARGRRSAGRLLARVVPYSLKRVLRSLLPGLAGCVASGAAAGGVDYRRSLAYPVGADHGVYVNLRGRQPQGIVEPGAEYEGVRNRVIEALRPLRDPRTGRPVIRAVHRREDIWSGPRLDCLPDLIVESEDDQYSMQTLSEGPDGGAVYALPEVRWDRVRLMGGHRSEGVLMAAGPHVRHVELPDAAIADVPATVLALLGCPIPEDYDGRVLTEMLTDDVSAPRRAAVPRTEPGPDGALPRRDEAAVRSRLEQLGYM
ncbi:MAG: hypothetical protein GXY85_06895 [Candidatus Brocadiaceae bacterium]|nr:hypothetical protein [Candidatus Brocadiaceae bacterium]